ncbi:MAG: response regulator [Pseudomonadota bacterium]
MVGEIGKKLILVVEDDADQRSYLIALFEDNGYRVVAAENGEEAFEVTRREKPALVSLDLSMPTESGVRFYRNLKADPDLGSTPVVIVSGVTGFGGDPDGFKKFISSRKNTPTPEGFVSKPVDQEKLLKIVANLLA